jgi:hypothetical protein
MKLQQIPYSIPEAAKKLGTTEDEVRARIKRGELKTQRARRRGRPTEVLLFAPRPDDGHDPVASAALHTHLARQAVRQAGGKVREDVQDAAPIARKTPRPVPVTIREYIANAAKKDAVPTDPALMAKARKVWLTSERRLRVIAKRSRVTERQMQAWVLDQIGVWELGAALGGIHRNTARELAALAEIKLRPGGHLDEAREVLQVGRAAMALFPLSTSEYNAVIGPGSGGGRSKKLSLAVEPEVAQAWQDRPEGGGRRTPAHDSGREYSGHDDPDKD